MLMDLKDGFFDQPSFHNFSNYTSYLYCDYIKNNTSLVGYEMFTGDELYTEIPIIPDGCVDIIFVFFENTIKSFVIGPTDSLVSCISNKNRLVMGVRFSPGEARNYLPLSSNLLTMKQLPLSALFNDCETLHARLLEKNDFTPRMDMILNYLLCHHKTYNFEQYNIIKYCVRKIIDSNGNIKISDIAEEVGYSMNYVLQLFYEYVGIPPKHFADIVKLYTTLSYLLTNKPKKFVDVATMFDYVDQSHMNKHFHKYLKSSILDIQKSPFTKGALANNDLSSPYYF